MEDMTLKEAGHKIREMAELTAKASKNWNNFEDIVVSMLRQAHEAGLVKGRKLPPESSLLTGGG